MKTKIALTIPVMTLGIVFNVHAVEFDWVSVGNVGNADDVTGYGGVEYPYRISKHEVTVTQYTEFLNAVDPSGSTTLVDSCLSPWPCRYLMQHHGPVGIIHNGMAPDGFQYEVKEGWENQPVIFVTSSNAMRFVNWLENGQGAGDTESGVYAIGDGLNEVRNPNATYFLPNEDEWYKAAYHKNDGVTGNYWDYPTSTDTEPYSDNPNSLNTPDDSNVANYIKDDAIANGYDDGYAVTGSTRYDREHIVTDVGAYSLAVSPYGTLDQGGNAWEWIETVVEGPDPTLRGIRGGGYFQPLDTNYLHASNRLIDGIHTIDHFTGVGFRVASVGLKGDVNGDGLLNAVDIDLLSDAVGSDVLRFDLDANGMVTAGDRRIWVEDLFGTFFGDADLNKQVGFSDFLSLSDNFSSMRGWDEGDFDGDGIVQFEDFLLLTSNFGNSATGLAAVPEPASPTLLLFLLVYFSVSFRQACLIFSRGAIA